MDRGRTVIGNLRRNDVKLFCICGNVYSRAF